MSVEGDEVVIWLTVRGLETPPYYSRSLQPSDGYDGAMSKPATWSDPAVVLATCAGLGRVPVAPGTFGSAAGIVLSIATGGLAAAIARRLPDTAAVDASVLEAAAVAVICLFGIPICTRAARLLGRGEDPGAIVFDELAAVPLALLVVPFAQRSLVPLVAGFLLFRLFDVGKPFPCRRLEHLPEGLGIMADDWAAAAWTAVCLVIARWQGWM